MDAREIHVRTLIDDYKSAWYVTSIKIKHKRIPVHNGFCCGVHLVSFENELDGMRRCSTLVTARGDAVSLVAGGRRNFCCQGRLLALERGAP
jgi:hypothetical protein